VEINPIRTKADYERTLREIEHLRGVGEGTPEGDQLEVLATLVKAYEQKHFPMGPPVSNRSNSLPS
jgi:HTH-type transcriptional regulator/antitoxin HigA